MKPRSLVVLASLAALAFAATAALPAVAAGNSGPKQSEDSTKWVLDNGIVSVWFQGKKPMLKVFPNGTPSKSYQFTFDRVVEFQDTDNNNVPAESEVRAFLNLDRADGWAVKVDRTPTAVLLNLTLAAPIDASVGPVGTVPLPKTNADTAEVSLLFHIYGAATKVPHGGSTIDVPAAAVKYDLVVTKWPWVAQSADRLALLADVSGIVAVGNANGDVVPATVATNGTSIGALSWARTAEGRAGMANVSVPVVTNLSMQGPTNVANRTVANASATRISWTFNAPSLDRVTYDPTIGLTDSAAALATNATSHTVGGLLKSVPAAPLAFALGAIALAAVVTRGRRNER
ncbi:MAG: hypothetical protein ACYDCK_05995 [Thermoplasmatota archaeon]